MRGLQDPRAVSALLRLTFFLHRSRPSVRDRRRQAAHQLQRHCQGVAILPFAHTASLMSLMAASAPLAMPPWIS